MEVEAHIAYVAIAGSLNRISKCLLKNQLLALAIDQIHQNLDVNIRSTRQQSDRIDSEKADPCHVLDGLCKPDLAHENAWQTRYLAEIDPTNQAAPRERAIARKSIP